MSSRYWGQHKRVLADANDPVGTSVVDLTVKQLVAHAGDDLEVSQRGDDGGDVAQHAAHSQQQQHEEVEHRPQLGQRHVLDGLAVQNEGQTRPLHRLQHESRQECAHQSIVALLRPISSLTA